MAATQSHSPGVVCDHQATVPREHCASRSQSSQSLLSLADIREMTADQPGSVLSPSWSAGSPTHGQPVWPGHGS